MTDKLEDMAGDADLDELDQQFAEASWRRGGTTGSAGAPVGRRWAAAAGDAPPAAPAGLVVP
jgi:hypothetical protein